MNTPICDFVKKYTLSHPTRFHMPGHKGKPFLGCESLDITEISGADVLYAAEGIIAESESNASELFGSAHTFYSTEGSSLCIKAMLSLVTQNGKKKILAARNVHKSFVYSCALLDLSVTWLYPSRSNHICECKIDLTELETELQAENYAAVYVTSPDYLGNIADVRSISEICEKYRVPLLVDNAHGAYLKFISPSLHPLDLGASMCCDSAHKTLPVLTGGAYLHISKKARDSLCSGRAAMSVFASTSPSYLILQSLDLCNRYISKDYGEKLKKLTQNVESLKEDLCSLGLDAFCNEPLKLTIYPRSYGYSGDEVSKKFRAFGIEAEFSDDDCIVFMISSENTLKDLRTLKKTFLSLSKNAPLISTAPLSQSRRSATISIREAVFSPSENIKAELSVGRICASPTVSCPPAVPIVISGEIIDEDAVALFKKYGIEYINVVKESR